ncbi:unnamed protein product [Closterium sp. Yama58-4]|nr:unnamed protein product [Closterium sp. Yama58-4]
MAATRGAPRIEAAKVVGYEFDEVSASRRSSTGRFGPSSREFDRWGTSESQPPPFSNDQSTSLAPVALSSSLSVRRSHFIALVTHCLRSHTPVLDTPKNSGSILLSIRSSSRHRSSSILIHGSTDQPPPRISVHPLQIFPFTPLSLSSLANRRACTRGWLLLGPMRRRYTRDVFQTEYEYSEKDVALYALGVGACSSDACDSIDLPFAYNHLFQDRFLALPTFAVLFPSSLIEQLLAVDGLVFDPALLLHGEQYLRLFRPLPTTAKVVNRARISALKDKGGAAIVDVETVSFDRESGARLAANRSSIVLRGAGGFSSKPTSTSTNPSPPQQQPPQPQPARGSAAATRQQPSARPPPHAATQECIPPNQALLYRLCGDLNPLHSDPEFAATAGYPRPILHGLCTLGFATRAILRTCCCGDPSLFHSVQVRFTGHVFPGETLITRTWQPVFIPASSAAAEEESAGLGMQGMGEQPLRRVSFECWIAERNKMVLSGWMQLHADNAGTGREAMGNDGSPRPRL